MRKGDHKSWQKHLHGGGDGHRFQIWFMRGTIYFEITEASFPAEHVFLKIKGKEKVHWRE